MTSQFNSTVYSLNAGVDWNVTSRCSGTLVASLSKSPAQLTEQVGTGVNYTTSNAVNETGKCAVANGYSLVFNSGLTTTTNSDPTNALNNARTALISAGIEYAKGASTLTALASISDQNFTGRGAAAAALGLATETDFHSFTLELYAANQSQPFRDRAHRPGRSHERIQPGSAQNAPADLYAERELDVYAEAQPERVRVTNNLSSDDGHRQRAAELQRRDESDLSADAQGRRQRRRFGRLFYHIIHVDGGGSGDFPFFFSTQNTYSLNTGLNYSMTPFLSAALNASYIGAGRKPFR